MRTTHKKVAIGEQPIEIAVTMLVQGAKYIFEKRPDDPSIGAASTVAAIGGKIEWGELADEAAAREISEETNLVIGQDYLQSLGMVSVMSDLNGGTVQVDAHGFEARLPCDIDVKTKAKAGKKVTLFYDQLTTEYDSFSPATKELVNRTYLDSTHEESHGLIDN